MKHTVIASAILGLFATAALAAPPPGTDPDSPTAHWVQSMRTPDDIPCCGRADCRPVHARQVSGKWQVWIDRARFGATAPDDWETVDDDVARNTKVDGEPPDLTVWACWYGGKVNCFYAPTGY